MWNNDIEDVVATCKETSRCKAMAEDEYDVVIVGAGCVGCSIARELSKYALKVLVLEAADDVTQGATKGNSGIVHAGYDDAPGSNRAKFCPPGNRMFPQLDKELKFGFQRNGSLVVARHPGESPPSSSEGTWPRRKFPPTSKSVDHIFFRLCPTPTQHQLNTNTHNNTPSTRKATKRSWTTCLSGARPTACRVSGSWTATSCAAWSPTSAPTAQRPSSRPRRGS